MLRPEVFNQESLYVISGLLRSHACAVRFDNNLWSFYDPNYTEGEKYFDNVADLIIEIDRVLSSDLLIEMASWNNTVNYTAFQQTRDLLIKENMAAIVKPGFLLDVINYGPDEFDAILTMAKNDKALKQQFFDTLYLISERIDPLILLKIEKTTPEKFNQLIDLALEDENIFKIFIGKSFQENQAEMKNKISGLSVILKNVISFPEKIIKIITLAKTDDNIQRTLIKALKENTIVNADILNKIEKISPDDRALIDLQINELRELELLKMKIRSVISAFAEKSHWCMDYGSPRMFKPISEGGAIVQSLLTKISDSKDMSEIREHLEKSKVDGQTQYNQRLDVCVRMIAGQPGLRL